MDDQVDMLVCRVCERPTCDPPDNLIEFRGLCPGCVIKQEVLPNIEPRFADLIDGMMGSRDDVIMEKMLEHMTGGAGGVAIVVNASDALDADNMAERVMDIFKHIILHDSEARAKLKDVIEEIDKNPPPECVGNKKPSRPVVRNDPRTG